MVGQPVDRVLVVSGWFNVQRLGQAGHYVGPTLDGEVLCSRFWAFAGWGCAGGRRG